MATTEVAMIERETFGWGVALTVHPFAGAKATDTAAQIRVDVMKSKSPSRSPELRLSFTGVPYSSPLKHTDALIWSEALKAILAEARIVVASMPRAATKTRGKK
jgi:hypothetical protein